MQTYHAEMGRTMDLLFLDEDLSVGRLNLFVGNTARFFGE